MRAAIFNGPKDITVGERPDPTIQHPTDAIVRVVLACVCGSDHYRGESDPAVGSIGHEFIGIVEDLGTDVTNLTAGDLVVAPFIYSDMSCPHFQHGSTVSCVQGGAVGNGVIDGGQGEAVRVPLAGSTLVRVPGSGHDDATLKSLLTLSDVMSSGHHAALSAGVKHGDTVAVVGDGADQAVLDITDGVGVDPALKCVGTQQAIDIAAASARPGSLIGIVGVGVPHGEVPFNQTFFRNVGWRGGPAPARIYIPELLKDVLDGRINPGLVLDYEADLDHTPDAYAAMDERRAIKSLLRVTAP